MTSQEYFKREYKPPTDIDAVNMRVAKKRKETRERLDALAWAAEMAKILAADKVA